MLAFIYSTIPQQRKPQRTRGKVGSYRISIKDSGKVQWKKIKRWKSSYQRLETPSLPRYFFLQYTWYVINRINQTEVVLHNTFCASEKCWWSNVAPENDFFFLLKGKMQQWMGHSKSIVVIQEYFMTTTTMVNANKTINNFYGLKDLYVSFWSSDEYQYVTKTWNQEVWCWRWALCNVSMARLPTSVFSKKMRKKDDNEEQRHIIALASSHYRVSSPLNYCEH